MKLARLFLPRNAYLLLIIGILFLYGVLPAVIGLLILDDQYFILLSQITLIAALGILMGHRKYKFKAHTQKRKVQGFGLFRKSNYDFLILNFFIFIFIFFAFIISENSIPIIGALSGDDASSLSEQRGAFLKQRTGFMNIVSYSFSLYVSSIMPFCIAILFEMKHGLRYFALLFMLFVSIAFLVKAMFLNFFLPLIALYVSRNNISNKRIIALLAAGMFALLAMISLAGFNESENEVLDAETLLSVSYGSSSPLNFLFWRSLVIPILTARDTLLVHAEQLNSQLLLGTTSGFISTITGQEQINIERMVFAYQFGGWNDIGNANSVFITDAYINFGVLGVFIFGFVVGRILLLFSQYSPPPLSYMALLFAFFLVGASLISLMLSGGFLILIFWRYFQRWNIKSSRTLSIQKNIS